MKKKLTNLVTIYLTILFVISFIGFEKTNNSFDENKAISKVVKYYPDFPSNPDDTFTQKIFIGGRYPGIMANVHFSTQVEKCTGSSYIVTLTKDWGITVNGTYAKSTFKYKVTPDSMISVEIIDKDDIVNIIK